jgi:hypothetical protein
MKLFATTILALCLVGCRERPSVLPESRSLPFRQQPLSEIAQPQEASDFQDVTLTIAAVRQTSDATVIEATGLHHGTRVGLRLSVSSSSTGSPVVRMESTGPQSDAFLVSLGELYHTSAPSKMKASAVFDAIPLKGAPAVIGDQALEFKLFCQAQNDDQYCELYLNTDVPAGTVEIAEKDSDYRPAVLAWLGQ